MKIYTKTGDDGDTGLFGGGRVPKDHPRVQAYGSVDELLVAVQRDLFSLGALLATPDPDKVREYLEKASIGDSRIEALEAAIDDGEAELEPLRAFIIPGGTVKAATLHLARTICRRAERDVLAMSRSEALPPIMIVYLNRLSDLLFVLARVAARRAGAAEVTW
ncbi:MAG TPA: cob(I)yrinic acid a,c-diamide adenosyltransferase [Gemmatimonadaceae bacterium]|nr:cob(I)yrinic acid a,c-diamide adenosyltransferase [Gemmatimonadaceae bacterium]